MSTFARQIPGSKKTGASSKGKKSSSKSYGHQKQMARKHLSDKLNASMTLRSELLYYPDDITTDMAISFSETLAEMDNFSKLNMRYLAGAVYLMLYINANTEGKSIMVLRHFFDPKDVRFGAGIRKILERIEGGEITSQKEMAMRMKRIEVLLTYYLKLSYFSGKDDKYKKPTGTNPNYQERDYDGGSREYPMIDMEPLGGDSEDDESEDDDDDYEGTDADGDDGSMGQMGQMGQVLPTPL